MITARFPLLPHEAQTGWHKGRFFEFFLESGPGTASVASGRLNLAACCGTLGFCSGYGALA